MTPPVGPSVVWQAPLWSQQPLGQVDGPHANPAHAPSEQVAPEPHVRQTSPSSPQAAVVVPGWQTPLPSQHPLQLSGLQAVGWQTPPRHDASKHGVHWAPPPPHAFGSSPGWHAPFSSQHPRGQFCASQNELKQVP